MQQKINRIYRNSRREYHLFIRQIDCVNESPELRVERSGVIANVTIAGLLIKGVIDTEAIITIINSNLQDFILFVSEAPSLNTTILLDDGGDNPTLDVDFLTKGQVTLVVGKIWNHRVTTQIFVVSVIDPSASPVVEINHDVLTRQVPTKKKRQRFPYARRFPERTANQQSSPNTSRRL
uniref:Uncharacterized protein n=1 Tax=Glossina palpalis gambiensis TaxID=67801 RepID=A0A1B0BUQ6_9MUSC